MKKRVAVLAFRGQRSCFLHALLNVVDLMERGAEVVMILEGESPGMLKEITRTDDPLHDLYKKAKPSIGAVCLACSKMVGALEIAEREALPISSSLNGHVRLSDYLEEDYEFITF